MEFDQQGTEQLIKECLEKAFLDFSLDEDGHFYVRDGLEFPAWVSVTDKGFIKIFTYGRFKAGIDVDEVDANKLVNRINAALFPNSVYQTDGAIWSSYYLPVMDGFSERHFIEMLRRSASAFVSGLRRFDEDNLIA